MLDVSPDGAAPVNLSKDGEDNFLDATNEIILPGMSLENIRKLNTESELPPDSKSARDAQAADYTKVEEMEYTSI